MAAIRAPLWQPTAVLIYTECMAQRLYWWMHGTRLWKQIHCWGPQICLFFKRNYNHYETPIRGTNRYNRTVSTWTKNSLQRHVNTESYPTSQFSFSWDLLHLKQQQYRSSSIYFIQNLAPFLIKRLRAYMIYKTKTKFWTKSVPFSSKSHANTSFVDLHRADRWK